MTDQHDAFAALYDLQKMDDALLELLKQRRSLGKEAKTLAAQRAEADQRLEELKDAYKRAYLDHSKVESQLEAEQANLAEYQKKLLAAADAVEYTGFERQIRTTGNAVGLLEEDTIQLMLQMDAAKEEMENGEKERALFEKECVEKRKDLADHAKELERQIQGKKEERAQQAQKTPVQILKQYARWRKARNTSMIAKVVISDEKERGGAVVYACSECSMNIPPQTILETQTKPENQNCPSCSRILWPPKASSAE